MMSLIPSQPTRRPSTLTISKFGSPRAVLELNGKTRVGRWRPAGVAASYNRIHITHYTPVHWTVDLTHKGATVASQSSMHRSPASKKRSLPSSQKQIKSNRRKMQKKEHSTFLKIIQKKNLHHRFCRMWNFSAFSDRVPLLVFIQWSPIFFLGGEDDLRQSGTPWKCFLMDHDFLRVIFLRWFLRWFS